MSNKEKADQIYRVWLRGRLGDNELNVPTSCPPMAFTVGDEYPEVLQCAVLKNVYTN